MHQKKVRLAALLILFFWFPAHAAEYTFPGCIPTKGGYSCKNVSIGTLDTITVLSPTTVTVSGTLDTLGYANINSRQDSSYLTFEVTGATNLGIGALNSVMNANVISDGGTVTVASLARLNGSISTNTSSITLGGSNVIDGSILTGGSIVTVGNATTITGNITTAAGNVTIGNNGTIGGSLSTAGGVVVIGDNINITGNIITAAGGVKTGNIGIIGGFITTAGGVVVIGDAINIAGNITTAAGGVTLGDSSSVGSISTQAGVVTTNIKSIVKGTVTTSGGDITLGGTVDGSLCAKGAGAVVVNANSEVKGNIETYGGGIRLGVNSKLAGTYTFHGAGAFSLGAGATVGSTASSSSNCNGLLIATTTPARIIKSRAWRQIFIR